MCTSIIAIYIIPIIGMAKMAKPSYVCAGTLAGQRTTDPIGQGTVAAVATKLS